MGSLLKAGAQSWEDAERHPDRVLSTSKEGAACEVPKKTTLLYLLNI